mgnify:CR=1 FL=1
MSVDNRVAQRQRPGLYRPGYRRVRPHPGVRGLNDTVLQHRVQRDGRGLHQDVQAGLCRCPTALQCLLRAGAAAEMV